MTQENSITDLVVACPSYGKSCEEARADLLAKGQKCAFAVEMERDIKSKLVGVPARKEKMETCAIPSLPAMMTQLHLGQKKISENQQVIVSALQGKATVVGGPVPPR